MLRSVFLFGFILSVSGWADCGSLLSIDRKIRSLQRELTKVTAGKSDDDIAGEYDELQRLIDLKQESFQELEEEYGDQVEEEIWEDNHEVMAWQEEQFTLNHMRNERQRIEKELRALEAKREALKKRLRQSAR